MTKSSLGKDGEVLAANFLKQNGYKILETNYRCPFGEVDIVAQDGETLAFVEVKTRSSREFGLPQEAVGFRKINHIVNVANFYHSVKKGLPLGDRIDVVAIEVGSNGKPSTLELIKNVTG